jgi:peptidoglycan/LPS O-acetylase OafA/YrhL
MSDLAVGSLFAYYAIYSQRFIQFFKTLPRWQSVLIYFVGIVLFFVRNVWADIPILYLNERLVFSFFFAFVILEQNYSESNYKIGKIKILTKLGQISYGLYMLHFVAIYLIAKSFDRFVGDTLMTVLLWEPLASLILSIVFAIISYNYFEKFFLGLKNKFQ